MHRTFLFLLSFLGSLSLWGQDDYWDTPFERSGGLESATYQEAITYFQDLADAFPAVKMLTYGYTDAGLPLHLVLVDTRQEFSPDREDRVFFLINNAIHPGESCGVDASMMLVRDLMLNDSLAQNLDHVILGIIPVYNIGGALNRRCCTRANQIGPESQGFRGNARNLDLNRDFMKMDARNTQTFAEIFQEWRPELFLDTHTTNGADYQAPITYLPTLPEKLLSPAKEYFEYNFLPDFLALADSQDLLISPYVNVFGAPPDSGMSAFIDLPRYASGYASLYQTLSIISEAHMLKPFAERVVATRKLMDCLIQLANSQHTELEVIVGAARLQAATQNPVPVQWVLDSTQLDSLEFAGYQASYSPGPVTGAPQLRYDRNQPYTKPIPYYPRYRSTVEITVPEAYLIPQAWAEAIDRLRWNGVEMDYLETDSLLEVEVSYIVEATALSEPYEGHYYHDQLTLRTDTQEIQFHRGDAIVYTSQWRRPFLVHALEPLAVDSWFRWNFFDEILMQKEYYSDYLFEPYAAAMLEQDPDLKQEFEAKKVQEPAFAANPRWQLYYLYTRSTYYEPTHRRYPIGRWNPSKKP